MNPFSYWWFTLLICTTSFGQSDTSTNFQASEWWQVVSSGNVAYKTSHLQLLPSEKEIFDMEVKECAAMKARDTLALIKIWSRDFSLSTNASKVVTEKTGLPYYLELSRMIETMNAIDQNTFSTTGYEMFRIVEATSKLQPVTKRKYVHTWTRVKGNWKLALKTY